jgi:hypothetical protein
MTNVHVSYRLIQAAGHHRQPRSAPSSTELLNLGTGPEIPGATGTQNAPGTYESNKFLFWSVSDGTAGLTSADTHLTYAVSSQAMELTAWYVPPGGLGPRGGSAFLIDAFSVAANDFVDDDFVTVTSDASLTAQANVAGIIPTTKAQTAQAFGNIHSENFEQWIGASSASGQNASFDKGGNGFAIATYKRPEPMDIPDIDVPELTWLLLLGGVLVDGGGIGIRPGGGPVPIDPWGPLMQRLVKGISLTRLGAGIKGTAGKQVQRVAAAEIAAAAEAIAKKAGTALR